MLVPKGLRMKANYMWKLYTYFLEYYNTIDKIIDIASLTVLAVNKANEVLDNDDDSNIFIKNPKTLLRWFQKYRDHDTFPNPSSTSSRAFKIHTFLSDNPDVVKDINAYCIKKT